MNTQQNTGTNPETGHERGSVSYPAASLWASAFVILALIIVQAGRMGAVPSSALAGEVSSVGDLTVLTAAGGDNEDVLAVLDRRAERLFVYGIENQSSLQLLESYEVSRIFASARNAATIGRP